MSQRMFPGTFLCPPLHHLPLGFHFFSLFFFNTHAAKEDPGTKTLRSFPPDRHFSAQTESHICSFCCQKGPDVSRLSEMKSCDFVARLLVGVLVVMWL